MQTSIDKESIAVNLKDGTKQSQNEFVSIEEFCQYTSLKIEQVEPLIVG